MKKTKFYSVAATLLLSMTMGFQSCVVEDNPTATDVPEEPQVEEPQYEALFTYDFAAAAEAGENPGNVNGSAANGQAFYAWENEGKVNSLRQDYKGYAAAEGSVLPEECHVWRRGDRINGNVADGGLKCPNDKEMAIDGLEAGYRVEITYDATEAADDAKELLWVAALGEEGAINTAKIGDAEAVTGETTIASGAAIDIVSVTAADNGTGYITFRARKGMVIQKVVISKLAE